MWKRLSRSDIIFVLFSIVLLTVRIYLGRMLSVICLLGAEHDDTWMLRCSYLEDHFLVQSMPWNMLLIKNIGYPIFLACVRFSGIQYTDVLAFGWFLAAVLTTYLFYLLTEVNSKAILLMIFAYVLFTPIAFDTQAGFAIYRNAVLAPAYFIILSLMAILFVQYFAKGQAWSLKMLSLFQVVLGIVFTWVYYMKEDGVWLLLCLAAILALCFLGDIRTWRHSAKYGIFRFMVLLIPLIVFMGGTIVYKTVNQKYFGVYEINTRTEGEVGNFLKKIYSIKSSSRTSFVWAPTDAIEKAFDASETLRMNNKLKDNIMHTGWFHGDIESNPIQGDFLGWVLLSSVYDTGTCNSLAEQEQFFHNVNVELDDAFASGRLEKDDRFQLVSSMGGRTLKEIFDLRFLIGASYRNFVTLRGYKYLPISSRYYMLSDGNLDDYQDVLLKSSNTTHIDLMENNAVEKNAFITDKIFIFYSVVRPVGMILAFIGIIYGIRRLFREKEWHFNKISLSLTVSVGALLLSFFYIVALAWFCEYIPDTETHIRFYGTGMIPMMTMFELFGIYLFYLYFKEFREVRR